jgi:hypothetical protein
MLWYSVANVMIAAMLSSQLLVCGVDGAAMLANTGN